MHTLFHCLGSIQPRACLTHGEMTFLNSKNKRLPLFCRVQLLFLCLLWTGSAFKTTQIVLCHSQLSTVLDFSQSRDLPRFKDLLCPGASRFSVSAPPPTPRHPGGGEVVDQYLGISKPLRVWNLTQFRTKTPLIYRPCLGQHPQFYYIV